MPESKKSIIQGITDFFLGCPLLKDGVFNVDYLGEEAIQYSVETIPSNPVIYEYVDGTQIRQYTFGFGSREYYTQERFQNIENSSFYEELSDWVEEQSRAGNFPVMPDDLTPDSLEVTTSGYIFGSSEEYARYQIQMRLIYIKNTRR